METTTVTVNKRTVTTSDGIGTFPDYDMTNVISWGKVEETDTTITIRVWH